MKMQYPEIVDVAMPAEGIFHNLMIVAIRKSYPGHARKIMNAIWSLGQAMFTKVVVVVDHDVDVQNFAGSGVEGAVRDRSRSATCNLSLGPVDTLDHAARVQDFGSKMGIDATRKWASGRFRAAVAGRNRDGCRRRGRRVDAMWPKLGLPNYHRSRK